MMKTFFSEKSTIFDLKETLIENSNNMYFTHEIINKFEDSLSDKIVTIVMVATENVKNDTSSYFNVLHSFIVEKGTKIQIIILDDTDGISLLQKEELKSLKFQIDYIRIKKKTWVNRFVTLNIGFHYILGKIVVIQDGEVSHVGDLLEFVEKNVSDDVYLSFEVLNSNINENKSKFLGALTVNTLRKIKGFSLEYLMGSTYNESDFMLKLQYNNVFIKQISTEIDKVCGLFLKSFYKQKTFQCEDGNRINNNLYARKKFIFNTTGKYVDLAENEEEYEINCKYLLSRAVRSSSF